MTIKEIETLSGLPRANIRYYESEGLIAPKRAENGYREYSQADAEVLLRVKLLRALPWYLVLQAAGYQIDYSLTMTGFTGLAEDGSLELPRNTTGSYTLSFDMRKPGITLRTIPPRVSRFSNTVA